MFSKEKRCIYGKNQLGLVVCQLRFPQILSIGVQPPVEFQEAIREAYPEYTQRRETSSPKVVGVEGALRLEPQGSGLVHRFASPDGSCWVSLSSQAISMAWSQYTRWEDFAGRLDPVLTAFIRIYHPAYFQRIGLQYINAISRKNLHLDGVPYRELIAPNYLGILGDEAFSETEASRSTVEADIFLQAGCRARIHAGPGMVKQGRIRDPEVKFVFDQDLYLPGKVDVTMSTGVLETLHTLAWQIFRGAITDRLHEAMEP